ncbi:MAG TPA: hypothetical protein QKA08_00205 [Candidatus Megaira endosymbiont of Nemacystus decipiens]|nr:hypothetical protein [Candidatus Megaera endosymbiont of Nemacystus decipiens]
MNKNFPYKLIDLTHTLSEETPSWDGGCGFNHDIKLDYDECDSAVKFRVGQIKMHAGIGIDTLSPDVPASGFPVHKTILGADKYIVENIVGLEKMPAIGAYVLTLPIKGLGLTEAPVRMVGLINNED